MSELYIGGQRRTKKGGVLWKIALLMVFLLLMLGAALKVSSPFIVERWLNDQGQENEGYAYSVREVGLSLKEGEMTLKDVKVFHPQTQVEILQSPSLKLKMNLPDILNASERRIVISADKLDVFLSKDLSSEIERMKKSTENKDLYFSLVEGEFTELNIIEKKIDFSRTLVGFRDVNLTMKELSMMSVNEKTQVGLAAKLKQGGEMSLTAKMSDEEGRSFWAIEGSLREFPPELLNKVAGSELPFTFNEEVLNAQVTARSHEGSIMGEIVPEVSRLNLIDERAGGPRQVIARALTDELTFSLPFSLKDELTLEYADTYKKLKEYRKYPVKVW